MKKVLSVILACIFCAGIPFQALADTIRFESTEGWSQNVPEIIEDDGVSYAFLKHTSNDKVYTNYRYTFGNYDFEGDYVVELRMKAPSASLAMVKTTLKGGTSPAVQIRKQYTSASDGSSWFEISGNPTIRFASAKQDIVPEKPDFDINWDTIYMLFDNSKKRYRVYVNSADNMFEGDLAHTSDGPAYVDFSYRRDNGSEANGGLYVEYIKVYPAEELYIPEKNPNDNFINENFDGFKTGDNLYKGLFGYMSALPMDAKISEDPIAPGYNKCVLLSSSSGAARYAVIDLGYDNAVIKYKMYMPSMGYSQLPQIRDKSRIIATATTDTAGRFNFGGQSIPLDYDGWNDFEWTLKNNEISVKVNGSEPIYAAADFSEVTSVWFAVWENNIPVYLDDLLIYEDNGTAVISSDRTGGVVNYKDIVYLSADQTDTRIYYTLDGSDPDENSMLYTNDGIEITEDDIEIKAVGINDNGTGRIFSFGRFYLRSSDGIVLIPMSVSNPDFAEGEVIEGKFAFINTGDAAETLVLLMGVYTDGALYACKTQSVTLSEGMNEFTLLAAAGKQGDSKAVRLFVWDREFCAEAVMPYLGYMNGEKEELPSNFYEESEEPTTLDVSAKIDNGGRIITLSGSVGNPKNMQELTIIGLDTEENICLLAELYPDGDGSFDVQLPFSESVSGGLIDIYIGGSGGIEENLEIYYVDSREEMDIINRLSEASSPAEIRSVAEELSADGIADLPELTDTGWEVLWQSRLEKDFEDIDEFTKIYELAGRLSGLYGIAEGSCYQFLMQEKGNIDFLSMEKYKIDENQNFSEKVFAELMDGDIKSVYQIEESYKTAYAIGMLNSALNSQCDSILKLYNDIFKLELDGEYERLSPYEVAKAMTGKNFTDLSSIRDAFNNRIAELEKSESEDNSGGGLSGGGGGGRGSASPNISISVPIKTEDSINKEDITEAEKPVFYDLPLHHWGNEYVERLYKEGIVNGDPNGNFNPDRKITRAEFAKLLVSALNLEPDESGSSFPDVPEGAWYYEYVCAASSYGIVSGADGYFMPDNPISRQDMAVMLCRAAEKKGIEFSDADIDFADSDKIAGYALEYVNKLCSRGIISGYEDNTFRPDDNLKRIEAAVVICRLIDEI